MNWYIKVIKDFKNFSGRARRKEYWMFYLMNVIFGMIVAAVDMLIGFDRGLFSVVYSLFVLVPELSLTFRRLHDIDKSAWWLLLAFVPVVGAVVLLIFSLKEGTHGPNRYGEDPKMAI